MISFHSPLPPDQSGVSDYSAELLTYLSKKVALDIYTDSWNVVPQIGKFEHVQIYPYHEFIERKHNYSIDFYQLGCGGSHIGPYNNLRIKPGISVIHDLNLSGIFGALYFGKGNPKQFLISLIRHQGIRAFFKASYKFFSTKKMPERHEYWMINWIIRRSLGVIVHTQWAKKYIEAHNKKTRVWHVNQAVPLMPFVPGAKNQKIKKTIGLDAYPYIIGVFGVVDENKGFSSIIKAFAQALDQIPFANLFFVGKFEEDHRSHVQYLGLENKVHFTGRVSMADFNSYLSAVDCVVALRHIAHGEMSGPLLRAMSLGKSVAISDYAQFSEFPDDVCSKIPLQGEVEALKQWMIGQWQNSTHREKIGINARKYIEATHNFEICVNGYLQVIREMKGDLIIKNCVD